jgi:hypothetical protein
MARGWSRLRHRWVRWRHLASAVLALSDIDPLVSIPAFNEALAEFQKAVPTIGKDQTANAGQYTYSYADLTTIAAKALPLLAEHGLSFTALPTMSEHGFVLRYALRHKAGHCEEGLYPLPDPVKANAQQIGSAITYGRRYSLCAVTGIAPGGEDDDGAAAKPAHAQQRPAPETPRDKAWKRLALVAQGLGWEPNDLTINFAKDNHMAVLKDATAEQMDAYAQVLEDTMAAAS